LKPWLPAEPALVGRDSEIEQLLQHLDSALHGKGTAVFISGEAGVGKTRLVNEFLNRSKKMGAEVLCGWCLSEAAIPYFPFTEAFKTYLSTAGGEEEKTNIKKHLGITGWLRGPEFSKEPKMPGFFSNPEIDRDRTFEAVTTALLQLSIREPIILFLDDLQWADRLSLALLHYLSRKGRNSPLLTIGTYRPEEFARAKEKGSHPLEETIFSMSREDLLTKMELSRLKQTDFPEFLESIFQTQIDEEFVQKLYEETEGNPLFALEALNLPAESNIISEKEGHWTLTAPLEKIGIPSKVHEVITQRIARLEREERRLVDLAAVCGFSFRPDILSRILASDITDVLRTLAEIEQRHRLIRSTDSAFEFTHHKIRETIYVDLPSELRKIYHLKTASCLEQALVEKISNGYLADIALHYVEGGALAKAFTYLLELGEKAVEIFANVEASEYLSKALEATQKNKDLATNKNLIRIYKSRGIAWLRQDERAKARNDFNLMLQNATDVSDESIIAEAHYWLGSAYEPHFGEADEAMRHLTLAVEIARKTDNRRLEARILRAIGIALIWGRNPNTMGEGCVRLEESSRIAKEIGDKFTEFRNLWTLGLYFNWKGEFNRAKENFNKVLAIDEEVGITLWIMDDWFGLCLALAGNGQYNEAISAGQRSLQIARDSGDWSNISMVLNTLGWIYHDLLNIDLAIEYNNDALEVARAHQKSRAGGAVPSSLSNLAMDYLYKKDYENAEKYFKEAINAYDQHRLGMWRMEIRVLLGLGEKSLAQGDYVQALKLAEDSLSISTKAGAKKYIAKGLKLKAEILSETDKAEEAIGLMQNALKKAQELGNPPLLWQTHYSLGLLLEKQGSLQKANEHHSEAIAILEETASKLNDTSLKNTLLTAPQTKEIQDACARTKPTS